MDADAHCCKLDLSQRASARQGWRQRLLLSFSPRQSQQEGHEPQQQVASRRTERGEIALLA
eukprot:8979001-Alexandrium_andersonii.AAC.1